MNKTQFGMKKDYYKRRQRENLARKRQHKTWPTCEVRSENQTQVKMGRE